MCVMPLNRRVLLAAAATASLASRPARAAIADDTGRTIAVPAKVGRVFAAGQPAAILLYSLAPDLLIGWPHASRPEQCAYLLSDICARPGVGALTGRNASASLDSVIALKPDLILDVGSTAPRYAALAEKTQQQTGIPYALLDGGIMSLPTTYEKLGTLTGRFAAGLDFGDYCNMTLGAITNRLAFVTADKRPRIYYARGPQGLTTGQRGASQTELIELLTRNVAGESKGGLADVTIEQVRAWDPDAIVATDARFVGNARSDPQWMIVRAVREGRVHLAPQIPFGWVDAPPSGNRLIGLWWLAKTFYPDLFKEDLRELTRDFYAKFYHVAPTDVRVDYVLAGKD
jgi:iron complex transport system substrate-binding protein